MKCIQWVTIRENTLNTLKYCLQLTEERAVKQS